MNRVLILAHREELIYQAVDHARAAGQTAGIEMGSRWARNETVVVSTVQTMNARGKNGLRMAKFDPFDFGLVITDEAHHATAKSYRAIYKHFSQNPRLKFLGVTATPLRADGIGLHNVFDSVAYEMDLREAIELGWLCPIRQRFVTVDGLDLSKVGCKFGGDLKDGELERAFLGNDDIDEERLLHAIAKPTIDQAAGQPAIVFAAGCEHAEKLTAAFNAYDGVRAELILGNTDKELRRGIVRRFKRGETQILVNVGVATEGFDAPAAAVVSIARPTKSESLYLQMIGRGTRPLPGIVDGPATAELRRAAIAASGKTCCVVLDFVGNSGTHKLVSVADVLAGEAISNSDLEEAVKEAKERNEPVGMEEVLEKVKQAREERERREEEERQRVASTRHYAERADYTAQDVDLFSGRDFDAFSDYTPAPDGATQKQVNYLVKLGVSPATAVSYSRRQATAVIDSIKKKNVGADYRMPFGKHAGKKLSELPGGYLRWAKENIDRPEFQRQIAMMEGRNEQPSRAIEEAPF